MSEALQRYPLPEEEQQALLRASMASEGLILGAGLIVAVVFSVAQSGLAHALPFGWLTDIAATMKPHWAMLALPIAMLAILEAVDWLGGRFSERYRQAIMDTRQGVTGELPRMRAGSIVACMAAAGICEELLFRYGLLGLALLGLRMFLPAPIAAIVAVVLVSAAFTAVHVQYRSVWTLSLVAAISCLLGGVYLATGSLLCVMFGHAAYNIAELALERYKMVREPDYFDGKVPVDIMMKTLHPSRHDDGTNDPFPSPVDSDADSKQNLD